MLCRSKDEKFVPIGDLSQPSFDVSRCYRTVNPALAFQYVSETPPPSDARVPVYFNNLNSWLGQTMQRDCGQVPLEIVDVETTGYVLRLCPFESLAFSGATLNQEDMAAFIEVILYSIMFYPLPQHMNTPSKSVDVSSRYCTRI